MRKLWLSKALSYVNTDKAESPYNIRRVISTFNIQCAKEFSLLDDLIKDDLNIHLMGLRQDATDIIRLLDAYKDEYFLRAVNSVIIKSDWNGIIKINFTGQVENAKVLIVDLGKYRELLYGQKHFWFGLSFVLSGFTFASLFT